VAKTPEGKVKDKVKALLKKHGAYQFWPVQMGYGAPCLDCIGWHQGRGFAVETKAPGKKPTKRQLATAKEMLAAGAPVFIIDGVESHGWTLLENWLASLD